MTCASCAAYVGLLQLAGQSYHSKCLQNTQAPTDCVPREFEQRPGRQLVSQELPQVRLDAERGACRRTSVNKECVGSKCVMHIRDKMNSQSSAEIGIKKYISFKNDAIRLHPARANHLIKKSRIA
jgi:hypothetical protein